MGGAVQSSKLSGGSYEDGMNNAASGAPAAGGGITMEEVAKHVTKSDCWVVVSGQVLDVTNFLSQHPGGELAILTFAGKDATEEFNMIHPPDVIPKYAPDAIIGNVGTGGPAKAGAAAAAAPVAARKDKGDFVANHHAWGEHAGKNWRIEGMDDNPGVLLINVKAYVFAGWFLMLSVLWEVCATIFSVKNFKISNDRVGLTRSAILLILFMVIHAVGNLHVFMGPDDFNGYGYFQFRFGDTEQFGPYYLRPPRYLINFWGILSLNLFWTDDTTVAPVGVRDIYALEYQLFRNQIWSGFYIFCVTIFMVHACLGWKKAVPVLGIPKLHVANVEKFGYAIFFVIGFYISFPLFVMFSPPFAGHETDLQYAGRVGA